MEKIIYVNQEKIGNCFFIKELESVKTGISITRYALFKCVCNNEFRAAITNVKQRKILSCGCIQTQRRVEVHTKHGNGKNGKRSTEYITWTNMKQRCLNKFGTHYNDYGLRGISISDEWINSFETFLKDMGERPEKSYTLDRKDNSKGYSKENCRWASKVQQATNRRSTHLINYNGETKTLYQWMKLLKIGKKKAWLLQGTQSTN